MILSIILYLLLAVILLAGLYINLVNAPGLWVMVAATIGFALLTHFKFVGLYTIVAIVVLAGIAEVIDFIASGAAAKKVGASKTGIIGAIVGGILGAIFLTVAVPIIGTILGVCLGTFLGALVGELFVGSELGSSLRVGVGAVKGRLLGLFTKLLFGCIILGIVLIMALPLPWRNKAAARSPLPPAPATTSPR